MIDKMRKRIITVSMLALILLLTIIFLVTNLFMGSRALADADIFLIHVIENDGIIKPPPQNHGEISSEDGNRPKAGGPHVFGASLKVSNLGQIEEVLFNDISMEESELLKFSLDVISSKQTSGSVGDYRYRSRQDESGYLIALADTEVENRMLEELIRISSLVGLFSIAVLYVFIRLLSGYIIRPVAIAMDKQKQFIADSSHELKTPLSIISANLDMLEMEIGANARTSSMSDGIRRMNRLIHELLLLARVEQNVLPMKVFDLSDTFERCILPLEVLAYENGKSIGLKVDKGMEINGNEDGIEKVIVSLMENAIKYSNENTMIQADLVKKSDSVYLEFYNEGIGVTQDQKDRLFDKFYRVDDSRQRATGGHGLGLAIVKDVVDAHNGKIQIESEPDTFIRFRVILPRQ